MPVTELRRQFIYEGGGGPYPAMEVVEAQPFVGGMGAVVGASPAQQQGVQPENPLEKGHHRDGPSFPDEHRGLAKPDLYGASSRLHAGLITGHQDRIVAVEFLDDNLYPGRCDGLDEILEQPGDVL